MTFKFVWPALALMAFHSIPAQAQSRIEVSGLSCDQAYARIASLGVTLVTLPGGAYERVVSNGGFCLRNEVPKLLPVRTRDVVQCNIGYVCMPNEGDRK